MNQPRESRWRPRCAGRQALQPVRNHWIRRSILTASLFALALPSVARAQSQEHPFDPASAERFLAAVSPAEKPYLVHTGARWVLPRPDARPEFTAGHAVVYLQFDEAPGPERFAQLARAGIRIFQAATQNTYVARIQPQHVTMLRSFPGFHGMEPVKSVDKLVAPLFFGVPHPLLSYPDGSSKVVVSFYDDVTLEHALFVLDRWDVVVPDRTTYGILNRVQAIATHGQVLALAEEPSVKLVSEGPFEDTDFNTDAARLSNVDDIQAAPYNLTGAGVRLGIWEVGGNPRVDHPDYNGRLTEKTADSDSDHATHVAGTMIGDGTGNPAALGMSSAAELDAYTSDNSPTEQVLSYLDGVRATNSSWGTIVGWTFDGTAWTNSGNTNLFGAYDSDTQDWDAIALLVPIMVQKSAGNDRDDCDPTDATNCDGTLGGDGQRYDTIPHRSVAKNIICVAATDDTGIISSFSSSGPADDGRVKPDLAANGTNLTSTWAGGVTINACTGLDYCTISGTSMSSPVVTGTIGLLIEHYRNLFGGLDPSPDLVKALLVNTAQDAGRPGPDYLYGHGILDALAAAQAIDAGAVRFVQDAVFNNQTDEFLVEVPPGLAQLRVTAAWVDRIGAANSANPDLVNNIDLTLISPNGTSFFPFTGPQGDPTGPATNVAPNPIDNVEHARIDNPQTGYWTARVNATAVPLGPQTYALVTNTAFFLEDEPNIDVSASPVYPPTCVGNGLEKNVVSIFNTGGGDLVVHDVSLVNGTGDFEVLPNPSPPFVLPPGSHIDVFVAFHPTAAGLRSGLLRIFSTDPDQGMYDIALSGVGGQQDLAASIDSKGYFGLVPLNYLQTKELQVINQGICDLTVTNLMLSMGSPEFSFGEIAGFPAFPFTLFPGESAVIYVTYRPANFGFDTGVFNLLTNDPDHPSVPVAVTGECPPPDITTTGSLRFGSICAGQLVEKTIDVCNTGVSDLLVTNVSFDPPCNDFTIINNPFPATVSHDFCLGVTVRYTPTGVGMHTCTLRIDSNDPDEPTVTVQATGTLLPVALDVAPDQCFPPTVTQALGNCETALPFPVTNTGECPVTITAFTINQALNEYSARNLPALPVTLLPGEQLGDGILQLVFKPLLVDRYREATVDVTYVTNDPMVGDTETVTRHLVGEGVNTGLRMVVRKNGVPIPTVDRIELFRILYPDTVNETLQVVQLDTHQNLQYTDDVPPCDPVPFHQEYGGETNPITLQPGEYLLWVEHNFGQGVQIRKERVTLDDWCDFEADIALDY